MKPLISIITPVYNEESNLHAYYERTKDVIDALSPEYDFEIIFTDNASSDRTFQMIEDLASRDMRIRGYKLSRNFGYQRSIWTGYAMARGSAVLELDADLQDPPELLPQMLSLWKEKNKIVYGVRIQRVEGVLISSLRKLFYRTIRWMSDDDLPEDAGDFMLLDRVVVNYIKETYDPNIYIRGLVFSLGFKRAAIKYSRGGRAAGESKFNMPAMIRLAVDGIVRHSTIPLRLCYFTGLFFGMSSLIMITIYAMARVLDGSAWPAGFATTTVIQLLSIGINSMLLGLIGEYLSRIYTLQRKSPMSIIERSVGEIYEDSTDDSQDDEI